MIDRKCTRQYWCPFREFGECSEIHPPLSDLHHLSLTLALIIRIRCLPLEWFPRLRAILDEVGRASAIETTIIVVSWSSWRKARPQTLLRLLLILWQGWSVEWYLLGRSGYPSARYVASRWNSRGIARDQPIPRRLWSCRPGGCFSFLFRSVGGNAIFLSYGHVDQLIEIIGLH
jgi:hypothetical protein